MKRLRVVLGAVGCAIALACFSDRGSGPTVGGAADCRVPVTVIDSLDYLVAIRNFGFHPDSLAVPRGATVTWVNCEDAGQEPHTTTSNNAVWDSPQLSPGDRFSHTFPTAGGFPYHCTPHPFMLGKVVVE